MKKIQKWLLISSLSILPILTFTPIFLVSCNDNKSTNNTLNFKSDILFNAINIESKNVAPANWNSDNSEFITKIKPIIENKLSEASNKKLSTPENIKLSTTNVDNVQVGIIKFTVVGNLNEFNFDATKKVTIEGTNTIVVNNLTLKQDITQFVSQRLYNTVAETARNIESKKWTKENEEIKRAITKGLKDATNSDLIKLDTIIDISPQKNIATVKFTIIGNLDHFKIEPFKNVDISDDNKTIIISNLTLKSSSEEHDPIVTEINAQTLYDCASKKINGIFTETEWDINNSETTRKITTFINDSLKSAIALDIPENKIPKVKDGSIKLNKNSTNSSKTGSVVFEINPELNTFSHTENTNIIFNDKTITINKLIFKNLKELEWNRIVNTNGDDKGLNYSGCLDIFKNVTLFKNDCFIQNYTNNQIQTAINNVENCENLKVNILETSSYENGELVIEISGEYMGDYSINPVQITIKNFKKIYKTLFLKEIKLYDKNVLLENQVTLNNALNWKIKELRDNFDYIKCSDGSTTIKCLQDVLWNISDFKLIKNPSNENQLIFDNIQVTFENYKYSKNDNNWVHLPNKVISVSNLRMNEMPLDFPTKLDALNYIAEILCSLNETELSKTSATKLKHDLIEDPSRTPIIINENLSAKFLENYFNNQGRFIVTVIEPENIYANDIDGKINRITYKVKNDQFNEESDIYSIHADGQCVPIDQSLYAIEKNITKIPNFSSVHNNLRNNIKSIKRITDELKNKQVGESIVINNDEIYLNKFLFNNRTIIFEENNETSNIIQTKWINDNFEFNLLGETFSKATNNMFTGIIKINGIDYYLTRVSQKFPTNYKQTITKNNNSYTYKLDYVLCIDFGNGYKELECSMVTEFTDDDLGIIPPNSNI